jgi:hypothetical protein
MGQMSVAAEPTTWERIVDLLSDGNWHSEEELEEVAYYPALWVRELEDSGYTLERSARGDVRLHTIY